MAIAINRERLMEMRFYVLAAAAAASAFLSLLWLGPSVSTVISFFWPLLLSTGFFLVTVAVLFRISPPPSGAVSDLTGEELMDYVAGRPQQEQEALAEQEEEKGELESKASGQPKAEE